MSVNLKKILVGKPRKTSDLQGERLGVMKALPILSSDALSSVAYGTEEILIVLATAGASALIYSIPISLAIIGLIAVLVISYRQVIAAYPGGGGAYAVSRDNLGPRWALLAGVALMIDYTLTVAVSVSAGVAAITSAFPAATHFAVIIDILLIIVMVIVNLRGVQESATIFAYPTYLFIGSMAVLEIKGAYDWATGHIVHTAIHFTHPAVGLTLFLLLRAFSSGCSAVTGIEAISNAVPTFKEPAVRKAKVTMLTLGVLLAVMFGGTSLLGYFYGVSPDLSGNTTVLSMIAQHAFGRNVMYYILQVATMLILVLAANTSFSGLPILASIMANDSYMPRMFTLRGDRLGFSNGIIVLGIMASLLVIIFDGQTDALIPLYAIGVFMSFTLSQVGLVKRWLKLKPKGYGGKIAINGIGALMTLFVTLIFSITKFSEGAWIVVILIPVLLFISIKINEHYRNVANELRVPLTMGLPMKGNVIIVPIGGLHKVVVQSIAYAKTLSDNVVAFYVAFDEEEERKMEEKWAEWNPGVRLVTFISRYRTIVRPLIKFIDTVDFKVHESDVITVVLPEFIAKKWWHRILHNRSAFFIRHKLLAQRDIVVAIVPYHLQK